MGNAGELGSIPGLGRSPGGEHGNPLQYSCLEKSHGQRSLAGSTPCGRTESDPTEHLSLFKHSLTVVVQLLSHFLLCDPMACSTPGSSVLHCLPGFAQIHVH